MPQHILPKPLAPRAHTERRNQKKIASRSIRDGQCRRTLPVSLLCRTWSCFHGPPHLTGIRSVKQLFHNHSRNHSRKTSDYYLSRNALFF